MRNILTIFGFGADIIGSQQTPLAESIVKWGWGGGGKRGGGGTAFNSLKPKTLQTFTQGHKIIKEICRNRERRIIAGHDTPLTLAQNPGVFFLQTAGSPNIPSRPILGDDALHWPFHSQFQEMRLGLHFRLASIYLE